jgi:hypothetical protein
MTRAESRPSHSPHRNGRRARVVDPCRGGSASTLARVGSLTAQPFVCTRAARSSRRGRARPAHRVASPDVTRTSSSSDASWLQDATALDADALELPLPAGTQLAQGRFLVAGELGRGGMGVVYEAIDHVREESVAIKTLRRFSPSHLQRLKSEFRALAGIAHAHLVPLYGLFCDEGLWFIAMQRVAGTTLAQRALRESELRTVFAQIANGIDALHRAGRVHRDLKPSNVMITPEGQVLIADFGLVSTLNDRGGAEERFCGTPNYAAPEQRAGASVQAPADWYAFGVMLREELARQGAAGGAALAAVEARGLAREQGEAAPRSHADLHELCRALLAQDPAARAGVSEVMRVLGSTGREATSSPAREASAFVGREAELAQLLALWETTRSGRARSALVSGESGVGKTALLGRLRLTLEQREPELWWIGGSCYPRETIAYNAVDAVVDELARHLRSLSSGERDALWPEDSAPLERMFPVLANLTRREPRAASELAHQHGADLRARAYAALRELLRGLARLRPVVIQIDDLHWGDAESAALLRALLVAGDVPAVLFVFAQRPDALAQAACVTAVREHAEELVLTRLDAATAELAAAQLLGCAPLDPVCRTLAAESGGQPFLLRELCRHSAATGQASGPLTLEALLQRRIANLPGTTRAMAELIALSARPLTPLQCSAALQHCSPEQRSSPEQRLHERRPAAALLDSLCDAQLMRRSLLFGGEVLEPYHARIREALRATLGPEELGRFHGALAATFEASAAHDDDTIIEHLLGAGLTERAAQRSLTAAEAAYASLSFERAAALLELALRVGVTAEAAPAARLRLANAYACAGHGARAAQAFLSAAELARDDRTALRCRAAHQWLIGGNLERGLPLLREVTKELGITLPDSSTAAQRALLVQRARLWWRSLDTEPALGPLPRDVEERFQALGLSAMGLSLFVPLRGAALGARYLVEALDRGDALQLTLALAGEAAFVGSMGVKHARRAQRALERARGLAARAEDPIVHGFIETAAAMGAVARGEFQRARDDCQAALRFIRRFGTRFAWEAVSAHSFLALSRFYLGELATLRTELPALLEAAPRRGDLLLDAMLHGGAGTALYLADDRPELAEAELARVRAAFPRGTATLQNAMLTLATCMLYGYRDDAEAAYQLASAELPVLQRAGFLYMPPVALGLWFTLAASALCLSRGDDARARRARSVARRAGARIARVPSTTAPAFAAAWRALTARADGALSSAQAALAESQRLFERCGLALFALAMQRQAGLWRGGEAGALAVREADAALAQRGVVRPERFVKLLLPTFSESERCA